MKKIFDLKALFFSLFLWLPAVLPLKAQDLAGEVRFGKKELSVREAFSEIEEQSGFRFAFRSSLLNLDKKVKLKVSSYAVSEVLRLLLPPGLSYRKVGRHLILRPGAKNRKASRESEIFRTEKESNGQESAASKSEPPDKTLVSGRLSDTEGRALAGASVLALGQNRSALTDSSGFFSLELRRERKFEGLIFRKKYFEDTLISPPLSSRVVNIRLQSQKDSLDYTEPLRAQLRPIEESPLAALIVPPEALTTVRNLSYVTEQRPVQVSLLPWLGTNFRSSGLIRNNFSLNILAGYTEGVRGLEIGGFLNVNRRDVNGVQIGGLGNMAGGKIKGLQFGGLFNFIRGNTEGCQAAGFMNNCDTLKGLQTAGVLNISANNKGLQISGLLNKAKKNSGLQIGLVNFSKESSGVAVGLLNFSASGFKEVGLSAHSFLGALAEYRMGDEYFYNIYRLQAAPELLGFGLGFGSRACFGKWDAAAELISHLLWPAGAEGIASWHSSSLMIGFRLKKIRISGGPYVGFWQSEARQENFARPPADLLFGERVFFGQQQTSKHFFSWNYGFRVGVSSFLTKQYFN